MHTFQIDPWNVCDVKREIPKEKKMICNGTTVPAMWVMKTRLWFRSQRTKRTESKWNMVGVSYCAKSYIVEHRVWNNKMCKLLLGKDTKDTAKGVLLGVNTSRFNIHEMKCCVRRVQFNVQFVLRTFLSVPRICPHVLLILSTVAFHLVTSLFIL